LVSPAVVVEALRTKEVVTPVLEVIFTGVTENDGVKLPRSLAMAVMLTAPVNPLTGAMVKTRPEEVAPGLTVMLLLQVPDVKVKSFCEVETKSTEAKVPSEARIVPLEPAKFVSPE
jgi:hypothetical protein